MNGEVEEWWLVNLGSRGAMEDGRVFLGRTEGEGVSVVGWSSSGISRQASRQGGRQERSDPKTQRNTVSISTNTKTTDS